MLLFFSVKNNAFIVPITDNYDNIAEFQALFVPLAAEAMVKALDIAVIRGSGAGQMLGVLNGSRIPNANSITLSPEEMKTWEDWKKKVFAKMKKIVQKRNFHYGTRHF